MEQSNKIALKLRPAFSSRTGALAFIALILLFLLLPLIITSTGRISRENSYEIMVEEHGAYSFIRSEIFENDEDIDILFLGSSIQWNAVDTAQVQLALSKAIGRNARVVSFGFNFNGIDVPYVMLRDLLERKRVRMVVFSIPRLPFTDGPNATAYKFLRYGDYQDAFGKLPIRYSAALYAGSVLRSPHDLLTLVRTNQQQESKYESDLGANKELLGMEREAGKYVRFSPRSPDLDSGELLFSAATQDEFHFTNERLPTYQDHFLAELVGLVEANGVRLVMLNIPQYNERFNSRATERFDYADRFDRPIPLIGVAPVRLFAGLSPDDIERLHCDRYHFNANGSEFFTRTITPAIVEVYRTHEAKDHR